MRLRRSILSLAMTVVSVQIGFSNLMGTFFSPFGQGNMFSCNGLKSSCKTQMADGTATFSLPGWGGLGWGTIRKFRSS